MHGKNLTKQTTSNCRLRTLCSRCWADETLLGHNKTNKTCRYKEVSEWVSMTEQTRFESQLYAITLATFVGRESAASLARFLAVEKCGVTKPFMNWRFSCRLHFVEDESLTWLNLTRAFSCVNLQFIVPCIYSQRIHRKFSSGACTSLSLHLYVFCRFC